jgi:DNA-binding CsgD family transcriptional regulator
MSASITMPEQGTAPLAESPTDAFGLTPRERETLSLLALGRTNRQIAEELFVSVKRRACTSPES